MCGCTAEVDGRGSIHCCSYRVLCEKKLLGLTVVVVVNVHLLRRRKGLVLVVVLRVRICIRL